MAESLDDHLEALREVASLLPTSVTSPEKASEAQRRAHWGQLGRRLGEMTGRRVLVVGHDVVREAAAFAERGAGYVLGCQTAINGLNRSSASANGRAGATAAEIRAVPWDTLDPASVGTFDVVHCDGLLHRVLEPNVLLARLHGMTVPGGQLIIGSMVLAEPELAEYLRYIPDEYAGDPTWRLIPGRLALRWMLYAAQFEIVDEFGEREGPRDAPPVVGLYVHAAVPG